MNPDVMEIRLNGRLLRIPVAPDWTGQVRLSVVKGALREKHGKLLTHYDICADCGSTKILTAGTLVGMAAES